MVVTDEALAHIEPAFRRFAALPDADRIAFVRTDRWIGFAQAEAALERLNTLVDYPPRDRMPCLLIYGETGMGKTKIIRKFERQHPPKPNQATGVTQRRLVAAQAPAEPFERDLYRELLAAIGAPGLIGGSLTREKEVCRSLLRTIGARVIVLDEINGMLAGTYRQQRIFLNALRFLANDLKVALVCAGTDLARQALLSDAQLAERFEAFALKPWTNDAAFARLLRSLAAMLPLQAPSDLDSPEVRERLLTLSDGVTSRIFSLVETAAVAAIRSGRERIDAESFADEDVMLPLVAMTQAADRRAGRTTLRAARR
jgi:hypothetical protein